MRVGVGGLSTAFADSSSVGILASTSAPTCISSSTCSTSIGGCTSITEGLALLSALADCIAGPVPVLCCGVPSAGSSIIKPEFHSPSDSFAPTSAFSGCVSFRFSCSLSLDFSCALANAIVAEALVGVVTGGVAATGAAIFD